MRNQEFNKHGNAYTQFLRDRANDLSEHLNALCDNGEQFTVKNKVEDGKYVMLITHFDADGTQNIYRGQIWEADTPLGKLTALVLPRHGGAYNLTTPETLLDTFDGIMDVIRHDLRESKQRAARIFPDARAPI